MKDAGCCELQRNSERTMSWGSGWGREKSDSELHQWSQPAVSAKSWGYNGWLRFPEADDVGIMGLESKREYERERWKMDDEIDFLFV